MQCLDSKINNASEIINSTADPAYNDRYADLLPEPQGEKILNEQHSEGASSLRRKKFVEVTGEGPIGQTMACLEMLARHHNVPFRRDVIERAAKDNLRGQRGTSLELIGNLSALMNFTGTLADLPEAQVIRALSLYCQSLWPALLIHEMPC